MTPDLSAPADVGSLVRHWRQRRRLSQQALSDQCGVSTRHLSYIETGKARPSPTMVGQLSEALSVPLRERRRLFTAAGFVPDTTELPLDAPALAEVNEALEQILAGREPYPALVIDGGWDLVTANESAYRLLADVPADLLEPPPHRLGRGRVVELAHQSRDLGRVLETAAKDRKAPPPADGIAHGALPAAVAIR